MSSSGHKKITTDSLLSTGILLGNDLESTPGASSECGVDNLDDMKEQLRDAQVSRSAYPSMLLNSFLFLSKFTEVTFIAKFFYNPLECSKCNHPQAPGASQTLLLFFDLPQVSSTITLSLHCLQIAKVIPTYEDFITRWSANQSLAFVRPNALYRSHYCV